MYICKHNQIVLVAQDSIDSCVFDICLCEECYSIVATNKINNIKLVLAATNDEYHDILQEYHKIIQGENNAEATVES